jgi:nicotinamide mononucleotide transporter
MKNTEKLSIGQKIKNIWNFFSTYEKIWFFSILILSIVIAIIFPEDDVNGTSGWIILVLYLADIFLNILCELLISKQSKWNFIVSLFVEIVEIATLLILAARFATMAVTIFFWIPIDIISFVNWNKHKDKDKEELTVVRSLKWWQSLLVILIVAVWTVGIGYLVAAYAPETDFYSSDLVEKAVAYLDACASVVGIANGVFILFRFREQWLAWYICSFLEIAMNILLGQWVLLVLKFGYLTNTTYGYIKWTKYIKTHKAKKTLSNEPINATTEN